MSKKWLYFGFSCLVFIIFFAVLECAARLIAMSLPEKINFWSGSPQSIYQTHPYLPTEFKPNSHLTIAYDGLERKTSISSKGFRGEDFAVPKPEGVFRIICLGGSTTYGISVSNNDKTWPAQLQVLLNQEANGSKTYEVINMGVPGYNTVESLLNLALKGVYYQPDLVIIYHAYNDFKANTPQGFKSDYSHWRKRSANPFESFLQKFRFYFGLKYLLGKVASVKRQQHQLDHVPVAGLRSFEMNLRNMIAIAQKQGAQVLLPSFAMSLTDENYQQHPEKFKRLQGYVPHLSIAGIQDAHTQYNRVIEKVSQEEHCLYVDLDRQIPKSFDYFSDHVHLTDRGALLVAETLKKSLGLAK